MSYISSSVDLIRSTSRETVLCRIYCLPSCQLQRQCQWVVVLNYLLNILYWVHINQLSWSNMKWLTRISYEVLSFPLWFCTAGDLQSLVSERIWRLHQKKLQSSCYKPTWPQKTLNSLIQMEIWYAVFVLTWLPRNATYKIIYNHARSVSPYLIAKMRLDWTADELRITAYFHSTLSKTFLFLGKHTY